ncbi:uncharacterized protein FA14DRAFT_162453 [Meira miltonrushii]|uniref:Uncharacterized protein n=1 Tax=Meira miltonrushii TaxID=1280837 RepID=A0A316V411_9BASI|nr:uncharacterized protein FA14DRAFT_162453 [Meira miltonrushii]PWN32286.1 hypothetical protein FA14DRAFT_162453 [Meira miltonrushii]
MSTTTNNQEDLAAYRQRVAASTQAALSGLNPSQKDSEQSTTTTSQPDQEQRQWRNLSDPKEYEKWAAERRDKPEDWKRYKDERLGGALSGGTSADQREYWKAKDALRGVETQPTQQQ